MQSIRAKISRGLLTLAVAGLGLAVPLPASADFIDFTVDEGTVPGTPPNSFIADKVNGAYAEVLSFDGAGGFDATLYVNFSQYLANEGSDPVVPPSLLAVPPPNAILDPLGFQYGLYAVYTASGTVTPDGSNFRFTTTSANAEVLIDPDVDTTKALPGAGGAPVILGNTADDYTIMTASSIYFEDNFLVPGTGGFFDIRFDDPTLTAAGQAYWLDLPLLNLRAIVDGDFDEFEPAGTVTTSGDVSLVFVPEPATLALFGLGLLGTGAMARRRRNAVSR